MAANGRLPLAVYNWKILMKDAVETLPGETLNEPSKTNKNENPKKAGVQK
jgi:hypothetical protein